MGRVEVDAGRTVLVYGPASITLIEGEAEILGYPMRVKRPVVVKSWRSRPVHVLRSSVFEFTSGEGGGMEVVEGDTVPSEWRSAAEKLVGEERVVAAVYGAADSGKTSLATLLANYLASKGRAVFMDFDVGQSSICPPTTIGFVSLRRPVPDVSTLRAERSEAVGYTSPSPVIPRHLEAARRLVAHAKGSSDRLVADMDGWVAGEGASRHKVLLLKALEADAILSIGGVPDEVRGFCEENGVEVVVLPPPSKVRRREHGARKKLREMAYERFLRNSVVRRIQASWVKLESTWGEARPHRILSSLISMTSRFLEDSGKIAEYDDHRILDELARERRGFLSYVYDMENNFSGIGLLLSLNLQKNYLRIYTPFQGQMSRIVVGSIILSVKGEELQSIPPPQVPQP